VGVKPGQRTLLSPRQVRLPMQNRRVAGGRRSGWAGVEPGVALEGDALDTARTEKAGEEGREAGRGEAEGAEDVVFRDGPG